MIPGSDLHLEEVLKPVVGNVISVCGHPEVLEPSSMNYAWSKIQNLAQKLTFYDVWSVITPWGGHRTRCWCCCCCCCTLNSIKTFFNQLIMVKNITEQKMKLLWCLETDIHLEWVLEHVVGIAVDVGLHLSNKTSFYHRFMIIFCFMGQKHVDFVIFYWKDHAILHVKKWLKMGHFPQLWTPGGTWICTSEVKKWDQGFPTFMFKIFRGSPQVSKRFANLWPPPICRHIKKKYKNLLIITYQNRKQKCFIIKIS